MENRSDSILRERTKAVFPCRRSNWVGELLFLFGGGKIEEVDVAPSTMQFSAVCWSNVDLAMQGHTWFVSEPSKSMLPMAMINNVGSPLWSWIYHSFDTVLLELKPIYMMWLTVRDFERI